MPKRKRKSNDNNNPPGDTYRPYFKISDKQTLELINLYKREEVLWNRNLEEYKIRRLRDAAVNRIVKELNIPNLEPRHVTAKFRNIRDLYCKEVRKTLNNINNSDQVYKPSVFWFNQMDFVKPFLNSRDNFTDVMPHETNLNESNVDLPQLDATIKTVFTEENSYWRDLKQPEVIIGYENVKNEFEGISDNENFSNISNSEGCCSSIPNKMNTFKKQDISSTENFNKNYISEQITLSTVSAKQEVILNKLQEVSNRKRDSYDNFATYAASLLRELPTMKALQLQSKIIDLIISEHLKKQEESA